MIDLRYNGIDARTVEKIPLVLYDICMLAEFNLWAFTFYINKMCEMNTNRIHFLHVQMFKNSIIDIEYVWS